jgi:hypothetical protein
MRLVILSSTQIFHVFRFGIIKDAAKSLLGVGKREKVPVLEDDYDYDQASLKIKSDRLKSAKTAKN